MQKTTFSKGKAKPQLGFRTSDYFRASKFGGKVNTPGVKFNQSQFRTQHKGGS